MPFPDAGRKEAANKEDATDKPCGLCGQPVLDKEDTEFIRGVCTKCGVNDYHFDCITSFLVEKSSAHTNSVLRKKLKEKSFRRPQEEFTSKRCPVGVYLGHWVGRGTGKHWEGPVCPGQVQSADWVKPKKAAAPPPSPPQPQPAARAARNGAAAPAQQPKQAAAATGKQPAAKQPAAAAAAPAAGKQPAAKPQAPSLQEQLAAARKAKAAATASLKGSASGAGSSGTLRHQGSFSSSASGGGGSSKARQLERAASGKGGPGLAFPGGTRPVHLRMCANWTDYGDCHVYNCQYAHGPEDLERREGEWQEEQAWLKEQKKEREQEQKRAALENHVLDQEALIPLSQSAFARMKEYKSKHCLNSLLEMGFDVGQAEAACEATGGVASTAVQLLTSGVPVLKGPNSKPVDVCREAELLLEKASALGFTAAAVEAQLLACSGDWRAAEEQLRRQAQQVQQAQQAQAQARERAAREAEEEAAAIAACMQDQQYHQQYHQQQGLGAQFEGQFSPKGTAAAAAPEGWGLGGASEGSWGAAGAAGGSWGALGGSAAPAAAGSPTARLGLPPHLQAAAAGGREVGEGLPPATPLPWDSNSASMLRSSGESSGPPASAEAAHGGPANSVPLGPPPALSPPTIGPPPPLGLPTLRSATHAQHAQHPQQYNAQYSLQQYQQQQYQQQLAQSLLPQHADPLTSPSPASTPALQAPTFAGGQQHSAASAAAAHNATAHHSPWLPQAAGAAPTFAVQPAAQPAHLHSLALSPPSLPPSAQGGASMASLTGGQHPTLGASPAVQGAGPANSSQPQASAASYDEGYQAGLAAALASLGLLPSGAPPRALHEPSQLAPAIQPPPRPLPAQPSVRGIEPAGAGALWGASQQAAAAEHHHSQHLHQHQHQQQQGSSLFAMPPAPRLGSGVWEPLPHELPTSPRAAAAGSHQPALGAAPAGGYATVGEGLAWPRHSAHSMHSMPGQHGHGHGQAEELEFQDMLAQLCTT